MWVWDRSIGLWLWGVFQPNQEIKCLFAQLDRPTTNQSNVVCDYGSGGSLACFCVYWTKKCRMSPDVSGTGRAQAALLPGARYEPRVSPVRGPELRGPRGPGAPLAAREPRSRPGSPARGPGAPLAAREPRSRPGSPARGPGAPLAAREPRSRPGSSARGICPASYEARPDNLIGLIICSSSYKARSDNLIGRIGL